MKLASSIPSATCEKSESVPLTLCRCVIKTAGDQPLTVIGHAPHMVRTATYMYSSVLLAFLNSLSYYIVAAVMSSKLPLPGRNAALEGHTFVV